MKQAMSILCSIAFAIVGIAMAVNNTDKSRSINSAQMMAATAPNIYTFPTAKLDTGTIDLSEDLVRDLAKKHGVQDTVYITKTDTIKEQVTKVKWRKAPVPAPVVKRDTIRETHYYLATQVGSKESPTGECIPIYEVHKVNEVCPEMINSTTDNDVDD